jgi:hypothetical protein
MRITWTSDGCETPETYQANARHACSLGLPFVTKGKRGSLAVAGGGPSISRHLDNLKGFDEIWGINRTAQWLCGQGITATFFTVDPQYVPGMTDVAKAIVSTCAHPRVLEELAGKDVALFHTVQVGDRDEFRSDGGPSSACRAIPLAVHMGYSSVTFFGCEGSYDGASHAYPTEVQQYQVIVRAGGRDFITQPDFEMQSQYIAKFIIDLPEYFKEESGGLLRAMIEHPDWEHVAASGPLAQRLIGDHSLDELPKYEEAA